MARRVKKQKAKKIPVESASVPKNAFEQVLFGWYAPEFLRYPKGWKWVTLALLIDFGFLTWAYLVDSWAMMLVFVVLPVVYYLEQRVQPKSTEVLVSQYGIKFGIHQIPYSDMKGFWIFHEPPYVDELHIKTNRRMHPEITIPLMGMDPTILRQYLVTQIPEFEGKKRSLLDILIHLLRLA